MRPRTPRRCTTIDKQGRFVVHRDIVKAMGLLGGSKIVWFINDDGLLAFKKAKIGKQR